MAELYKIQSSDPAMKELSFDERFALLIDGEADDKYNKQVAGIKHRSKIKMTNASVSDIRFYPDREIDKMLTMKLADCNYIHDHLNVIVVGATGAGKTYYVSALGNAACSKAMNVKYVRLPDMLYEMEQARKRNTYQNKLRYYARADLLIIDEWLLNSTTPQQQSDILEILELRYDNKSTIFASQFLPEGWHENLGGSAVADAILDRVLAHSYLVHIKGNRSMRIRDSK